MLIFIFAQAASSVAPSTHAHTYTHIHKSLHIHTYIHPRTFLMCSLHIIHIVHHHPLPPALYIVLFLHLHQKSYPFNFLPLLGPCLHVLFPFLFLSTHTSSLPPPLFTHTHRQYSHIHIHPYSLQHKHPRQSPPPTTTTTTTKKGAIITQTRRFQIQLLQGLAGPGAEGIC